MKKLHKPKSKKAKVLIALAVIAAVLLQFRLMLFPALNSYTLYGKRYIGRPDCLCEIDFKKLGNYEDYKYQYHRENIAFWSSDAYVLTVQYSKAEYQKQCEYINEFVAFFTGPVTEEDYLSDYDAEDYVIFPKAEFKINNWQVKTVASGSEFPWHMHFIAFNADESKIAYFDFADSDFDGFADEGYINTFFNTYFDYKFK